MIKKTHKITVQLPKQRNPFHNSLRILGSKKIPQKRGRGSYKREKSVDFFS